MKRKVKQKRKIHENQQSVLLRSSILIFCNLKEMFLFQTVTSLHIEFMYAAYNKLKAKNLTS